jgi:hypothetical protein
VTTLLVLILLVAVFAAGRLFQWVRDARGMLNPGGRHSEDRR